MIECRSEYETDFFSGGLEVLNYIVCSIKDEIYGTLL